MSNPRGFAAISLERRREISRLGGKSVPAEKRTFFKDRKQASEAGKKGGSRSKGPTATD